MADWQVTLLSQPPPLFLLWPELQWGIQGLGCQQDRGKMAAHPWWWARAFCRAQHWGRAGPSHRKVSRWKGQGQGWLRENYAQASTRHQRALCGRSTCSTLEIFPGKQKGRRITWNHSRKRNDQVKIMNNSRDGLRCRIMYWPYLISFRDGLSNLMCYFEMNNDVWPYMYFRSEHQRKEGLGRCPQDPWSHFREASIHAA